MGPVKWSMEEADVIFHRDASLKMREASIKSGDAEVCWRREDAMVIILLGDNMPNDRSREGGRGLSIDINDIAKFIRCERIETGFC